jgi:hypothetical protein
MGRRATGMEEHREKCLIEEKSHKKQIICLKDEVYGEERNLSVYLFCAKGCCLPGSLTKNTKAQKKCSPSRNVAQLSTQANVEHKKYKLWSDIIFVG